MGHRVVLLFGASGQIGSAFKRLLDQSFATTDKVMTVPWSEASLCSSGVTGTLKARLKTLRLENPKQLDVVFANGLTDPRLDPEQILASNLIFPRAVMEEIESGDWATRIRYLTLGSVHEAYPELCAPNVVLKSKLNLSRWMFSAAQQSLQNEGRFLHLRMHGIYSIDPKGHTVFGKIANALATQTPFEMSKGMQLREFHHADDVACSLMALVSCDDWGPKPTLDLSSGQPVKLRNLALEIFSEFHCRHLLKLGALPCPQGDSLGDIHLRSPSWLLPQSRPIISGTVLALKQFVQRRALVHPIAA